jgi:hypothetical protein
MWAEGFWVLSVWCYCRFYGLRWGSCRFFLMEIHDCMGLKAMEIGTHDDGSVESTDKRQHLRRCNIGLAITECID